MFGRLLLPLGAVAAFVAFAALFADVEPRLAQFQERAARSKAQDNVQAYMGKVARDNDAVMAALGEALPHVPGAARVRVLLIHQREGGALQFDVVYSVAAPGHAPGALVADHPLSEWYGYLGPLLAGKCAFVKVGEMQADGDEGRARERLTGFISAFLGCPITDGDHLIGGVFASWDDGQPLPSEDDLRAAEPHLRAASALIARVLANG